MREKAAQHVGKIARIERTGGERRPSLTPEQYRVTRRKRTQRAFSGDCWDAKARGSYVCVCCGFPLVIDGPAPTGQHFCMNSASLRFADGNAALEHGE